MKNKLGYAVLISSMMISAPISSINLVHAEGTQTTETQKTKDELTASYQEAINDIRIPKYNKKGNKVDQKVSKYLQAHLKNNNITAIKDEQKKTLTFKNVQLKNVDLTSDYVNGKSAPGTSYFNMMNYFTDVKQVHQLLKKNNGYTAIDSQGEEVSIDYVADLEELLQQINDFDPTTDLEYDWSSAYDTDAFKNDANRGGTDVIATSSKNKDIKLKFHIDSHGWWGYDLGAHDSFTGLVMGQSDKKAQDDQHEETMKYANFFVIKMKEDDNGTWYMLNDTDLQNPMIYVNKDKTEAFMIDVDFYGARVINQKIKDVIGDKCQELKIFCTHNHGDHVNNLAVIGQDADLRNITTIIWPENEPHTVLSARDTTTKSMVGKDLIDDIDWNDVQTVADGDQFEAGGSEFQFVEIPNEHTPGGGQLADLTHKVIYSGDSLGAQIHLGGTTVQYQNLDNWIAGAKKSAKYVKDNGIQYNIGAHTPYLNNPNYASWMATALEYGKENTLEPDGERPNMNLVITENGKVVNGTDRYGEIMKNGLTDRGELNIASVNVMRFKSEDDKKDEPQNEETKKEDTPKTEEKKPAAETKTESNASKPAEKKEEAPNTTVTNTAAPVKQDTAIKLAKVKKTTVVAKDGKSVKVTWKAVKNAQGYEVAYKKNNGSWTYKKTSKNNFTIKAKKNQAVAIKVRALSGNSKGHWSKTAYRYLEAVKITSVKNLNVKTTKTKGTGYQLAYSTSRSGQYVNKTIKSSKKINLNGKYFVKVRSYKKSNGHIYTGRYSDTKAITIK